MTNIARAATLLFALFLAGTSPAWSHANLVESAPADGAVVSEPPAELVLRFSEGVELAFSTVSVTDEAGEDVAAGSPEHLDGEAATLSVPLGTLQPGTYTAAWDVLSVDTHRVEGSISFTVR